MSDLIKSSSGLMFSEQFDGNISLLWDLSPNNKDRVIGNIDSISLLHGDEKGKLLIPIPAENNYVMQSKIDYSPVTEQDKAGVTIESVTDVHVDLEICGDDDINAKYTKMCVDDYNILTSYASLDGSRWINYGNTKLNNMNTIGYYNDGKEAELKIYNCIVYKNNYITINGIDRKNHIRVFDKNNNEITNNFFIRKYNTRIVIDGVYAIFPIDELTINIYRNTDNELLVSTKLTEIYGGDIYEFKYNLDFKINDNIIENNNVLHSLCDISSDTIFDITIINRELYDIYNKTIKVSYYSYLNKSYKFVKIATENSNVFLDKIENVNFPCGSNTKFKLKIDKNTIYSEIEEQCEFSIIIE